MKKFCSAVSLVFFLALLANAQEVPPSLSNDSLSLSRDSSLAIIPPPVPDSSLLVASPQVANTNANKKEKFEKKLEEKKVIKKQEEYNPEDYQKNLRVSAYLHPLPFVFGAAYNMFMFSATVEIPFNLSNSVVIQPTVWLGSSDGYIPDMAKFIYIFRDDEVEFEKLKRAGASIGFRHYIVDKSQGFYLQAMATAFYISAESISLKENDTYDDDDDYWGDRITTWKKVKNGVVGEFMFYIGSAHKWNSVGFFYEGGLGYGYDGTKTYQIGYSNRLVTTFNVGVGVPFF